MKFVKLKKCYREMKFVEFKSTNPILVLANKFVAKFFVICIHKISII